MIELNNVSKSYPNGFQALEAVNLSIQEGEIFGIIGKSGAGKSTLLRCMSLLERPSLGDVIVDKRNLCQLSDKTLRYERYKMAMIFQQFNLLNNLSVEQNIALPMIIQGKKSVEIDNRINELLDLVKLEDKRFAYPNQLSGGQKQRVAIARALSCFPKILFCDEATSALDPKTTHDILDLLKNINQQLAITIVMITHEMDVIKQACHRLALIDEGQVKESMATEDVFKQDDKSLAKELITHQLTPKLPDYLQQTLQPHPSQNCLTIAKIIFHGQVAKQPLISWLSRKLAIDINILQANIDAVGKTTFGVLVVELHGEKHKLAQFFGHCQQHELAVEVLGYVK
jgi:D-methionine transport system ATP-binding protein